MCLVPLQVPKCFGLVQIFCARPKIYLHILAVTNILYQTKRWFAFSKIVFCAGTKVFEEALFKGSQIFGLAQKIWTGTKHFGTCKRTRHTSSIYIFNFGADAIIENIIENEKCIFKKIRCSQNYSSLLIEKERTFYLFSIWVEPTAKYR